MSLPLFSLISIVSLINLLCVYSTVLVSANNFHLPQQPNRWFLCSIWSVIAGLLVFVSDSLFPGVPDMYLATDSYHLKVMFFKASAKFSTCLINVDKITISTWSLVDGMGGVKLVSCILRVNRNQLTHIFDEFLVMENAHAWSCVAHLKFSLTVQ